jgi:hypothetical protein
MRGLFSIKRTVLVGAFAALLLPISFTPGKGVNATDACANGACCTELRSSCHGAQQAFYCINERI